jgi:hypothetical protein
MNHEMAGTQGRRAVGHSYGGMVLSGVAEKMEKAIASFVMLDAFFPEDRQSLIDVNVPPDRCERCHTDRLAQRRDRHAPAAGGHVQRKRARSCTPHPIKCFTQKLALATQLGGGCVIEP